MNRIILNFSLVSSLVFFSSISIADIKNGKELHQGNCTSCHISMQGGDGSSIYTRENKRIESHPALIKQVKRCRDSLGVPWPEEHVNDVVEYLNNNFYNYKK